MDPSDHLVAVQEKDVTMFCFTCTQAELNAALAEDNKGTICTDSTGRFPVRSFRGNQHMLVCCSHETNAILVRPMKDREAQSHIAAHTEICECLTAKGCKPKLHVLDNECSKMLEKMSQSMTLHANLWKRTIT